MSVTILDDQGCMFFQILENEMTFNPSAWDVEMRANTLVIRTQAGQIELKVVFEPPDTIRIEQGVLRYNGWFVHLSSKGSGLEAAPAKQTTLLVA